MIDLATPQFWSVAALAILVVTPVARPGLKRLTFALSNLAFLTLISGAASLPLFALAFTAALWALLRLTARTGKKFLTVIPTLAALLFLFLTNKDTFTAQFPLLGAHLAPLLAGLSFSYVFLRALDVTHEVATGSHPPPGLVDLLNFLVPFHMLAAGPIQSWKNHTVGFVAAPNLPQAWAAVSRIIHGLFKKFVVAALLMQFLSTGWRAEEWWYRLLEINAQYIWLYIDFSAYTDIAIGIGTLMGVPTPENFGRPLTARNMTVFWERWHITLSNFVRFRLFFPLQVALVRRFGHARQTLWAFTSALIAFVLCGFWHSPTKIYILWGFFHGAGVGCCLAYREILQKKLGKKGVRRYMENRFIAFVSTVLTFEFVAFSFYLVGDGWLLDWVQ